MKISKKLDYSKNIELTLDIEKDIVGKIEADFQRLEISLGTNEENIVAFLDSLNAKLNVKINGKDISLIRSGSEFYCDLEGDINTIDILADSVPIASYTNSPNGLILKDETLLDSYFIKNSILNEEIDCSDIVKVDEGVKTDLHTHYAGAPSAIGLIEVGLKNDLKYPTKLLGDLGIKVESAERTYPLNKLSAEDLVKLEKAMQIPVGEQIRFAQDEVNLQNIYAYRQPFFREASLTPDLLEVIAKEYSENGVKYVELSGSHIFDLGKEPQMLKLATETIPKLEEKYGISLRFLGAMCRRDDLEWSLDELEKLKLVANNPYIAGIDVVGHETNSTLDIAENIKPYMQFAKEKGLDWTFRFHAGENPSHPENVKEALKLADKYGVKVRIGHGLYGIDQETLDLAVKTNAIIEINSSSNLALNNVTDVMEMLPMVEYLQKGIPVVLGTDSPGIYQTDSRQELIIAKRLLKKKGVSSDLLERISLTEEKVMKERSVEENRLSKIEGYNYIPPAESFHNLSNNWTPAVEERKREQEDIKEREVKEKINKMGSTYISSDSVSDYISKSNKTPFVVSGASKSNWSTLTDEEKNKIELEMAKLLNTLDPKKFILVTGGTDYGVEKLIHDNAKSKGFEVLGVLTDDATVDEIQNPNITTYTVAKGNWWAKSSFVMDKLIKAHDGKVLFVAGGPIVADEILSSVYHRLPPEDFFLLTGVGGSSDKKAKQLPKFAITDMEELRDKISYNPPNLEAVRANIEKIKKFANSNSEVAKRIPTA